MRRALSSAVKSSNLRQPQNPIANQNSFCFTASSQALSLKHFISWNYLGLSPALFVCVGGDLANNQILLMFNLCSELETLPVIYGIDDCILPSTT